MRWNCDPATDGGSRLSKGSGTSSDSVVSVSMNGSAAAVIRAQTASISSSGGVVAGSPEATVSRIGLDLEALPAHEPDQSLVPGEVADHPRDRVHRQEALAGVLVAQSGEPALPFGAGEPELVGAWMGHGSQPSSARRTIAPSLGGPPCPARPTCRPTSDASSTRSRSEIGETDMAVDDIERRGEPPTPTATTAGWRPPSARSSSRSARTPTARAWSAPRTGSTGCTRS